MLKLARSLLVFRKYHKKKRECSQNAQSFFWCSVYHTEAAKDKCRREENIWVTGRLSEQHVALKQQSEREKLFSINTLTCRSDRCGSMIDSTGVCSCVCKGKISENRIQYKRTNSVWIFKLKKKKNPLKGIKPSKLKTAESQTSGLFSLINANWVCEV